MGVHGRRPPRRPWSGWLDRGDGSHGRRRLDRLDHRLLAPPDAPPPRASRAAAEAERQLRQTTRSRRSRSRHRLRRSSNRAHTLAAGATAPPVASFAWHRRGVAQSGSALALGARGRRFESGRPDRRHRAPECSERQCSFKFAAARARSAALTRVGDRYGVDGGEGCAYTHTAVPLRP